MTPFGLRMRELRKQHNLTQKELARDIGVSSAYLSALEHGRRGRPSWYLLQRIITRFNIIWDEAEDLITLARLSHPRMTVDTAGLSPRATELVNRLSLVIADLSDDQLARMLEITEENEIATQNLKNEL